MDFCFSLKAWIKISVKVLSGKYSLGILAERQKLLDHAKQSATEALKTTSKKLIQKTTEATGDFIGNKIADAVARSNCDKITGSKSQSYP